MNRVIRLFLTVFGVCILLATTNVNAANRDFRKVLYDYDAYNKEGAALYRKGRYYDAARYFFQAGLRKVSAEQKAVAYARTANSLTAQGLYESASYFYLKAISSGYGKAIKIATRSTMALMRFVGGNMFKKYMLKYTRVEQYSPQHRDYYRYFLARNHLLANRPKGVIQVVSNMKSDFTYYPQALFFRGTANLLLNNIGAGIQDFKRCVDIVSSGSFQSSQRKYYTRAEMNDLKNRCIAGVARAYYQDRKYVDAGIWYNKVDISSIVWPQIQYEWAWNYVAQGQYNRSLGKLVTYKSPALDWFLNSEVTLLRALSYLQLCLYDDVNSEIDQFVKRYAKLGSQVKNLLESTSLSRDKDYEKLFNFGVRALRRGIYDDDKLVRFMNRFVRAPYFMRFSETSIKVEEELRFINNQKNTSKKGLGGFLKEVLDWRARLAVRSGGFFIQQRLDTEYRELLKNVQTMDIAKLEMLRRAKRKILDSSINETTDRFGNKKRGSLGIPKLTDQQYFWEFNGEFWADELGDYVFALRPECG